MNKYFVFIAVAVCVLFLGYGLAAGAEQGDRVCIYKHDNFHGHEQCYRPGDEVSDLRHAEIGSIRVFGHARAMLYEDRDFSGHMMETTANVPDLKRIPLNGKKEFHDHIGSLRVTSEFAYNKAPVYNSDYAFYRFKPFPIPETLSDGVCVYDRPNFEGRQQCWAVGTDIPDLNFSNWKDRVSSIRVLGNGSAVGYKDFDFRGERIVIDHDVSNLSDYPMRSSGNWNHEMRSMKVQ